MSPEVIKGSEYGTKTDVYSFAILMFEVLSDSSPYPDLENGKMPDFEFRIKVANENYRPVFKYPIKENLRKLIEDCWSHDPDMRPTFAEIFSKLSSEEYFIDDVDSNDINLYIQDITEICDPLEKLIQEKDVTEKK